MSIATTSQHIRSGIVEWHVELTGQGPDLLLVHGTAASSHSWRKLVPVLAESHRVLNLDLPGHGQSKALATSAMSLDGMTDALNALLQRMKFEPQKVVGHSAGAVILTRLCARFGCSAKQLISFNGAFFPFGGAAGSLFSPIAKLVAMTPFLPSLLSGFATRQTVERLLRDTGSTLSGADIDAYFALFKKPSHVAAALDMMANWNLTDVSTDLAAVKAECLLVAGDKDKTVPPETAKRAAAYCKLAEVKLLPGLGHLLHEEQPLLAASIIRGDHKWQM